MEKHHLSAFFDSTSYAARRPLMHIFAPRRLERAVGEFRPLYVRRGHAEDESSQNDGARQADKLLRRNMCHNTTMILKHCRDIVWALECLPDQARELEPHRTSKGAVQFPYGKLDKGLIIRFARWCAETGHHA